MNTAPAKPARRDEWIFVAAFLLGGATRALPDFVEALTGTPYAFLTSACFVLNLGIYQAVLLYWIQSVRRRLLPSRGRRCLVASAWLMLLLITLRGARYRVLLAPPGAELSWYMYYVPIVLVPTLMLMGAVRMGRSPEGFAELWLLLPAVALILGVLTNAWHHLAFVPRPGVTVMDGSTGTYDYGPVYFGVAGWVAACFLTGIALLSRAARSTGRRQLVTVPLAFVAALGLVALVTFYGGDFSAVFHWKFPEMCAFTMLGVLESCIRGRLIPYNENYAGCFRNLSFPALIADADLKPVYRTAEPLEAGDGALRRALEGPVALDADETLRGMPLRAGCAFWIEDEGELRRMNERLADANETLATENTLIRAENALREQRARVESRNRIYSRVAAELYPTQRRIAALLDQARPGEPGFREMVARCCVLNAYVKRRTNLLLMQADGAAIDGRDLLLALDESARYLGCCGVEAAALGDGGVDFSPERLCALYDSFEALIEALLPRMRRLTVSLVPAGLRLAADCPDVPELPDTPLPVTAQQSEGILYLTVSAKGGGAA